MTITHQNPIDYESHQPIISQKVIVCADCGGHTWLRPIEGGQARECIECHQRERFVSVEERDLIQFRDDRRGNMKITILSYAQLFDDAPLLARQAEILAFLRDCQVTEEQEKALIDELSDIQVQLEKDGGQS